MTEDPKSSLPFSQRTGLQPIPPQLQLGEVSPEFRRLISFYVSLELERVSIGGYNGSYFDGSWKRVAQDLHVKFLGHKIETFKNEAYYIEQDIQKLIQIAKFDQLFDFLEFLVQHAGCSAELKAELARAFIESRAAYRLIDRSYIVAIGTDEQAKAFVNAIAEAEEKCNFRAETTHFCRRCTSAF